MSKRRCDHFVGCRLTGGFDSAVGITASYTYKPNANDISEETVTRNLSPVTCHL